jgi:catechol-2,3-dioxygenase
MRILHVADRLSDRGGADLGSVITLDIPGEGSLTLIYMTDPEGNIVELQYWH